MEGLVGNEENEYTVPDPNRTMINMNNELNDVHKKFLKEKIMKELIEILKEKVQEMDEQDKQDELKKYHYMTNKKLRIHRNN
jgi:hypothetical protein